MRSQRVRVRPGSSVSPSPKQVSGNAGEQNSQSNQSFFRFTVNRMRNHYPADGGEQHRRKRVSRHFDSTRIVLATQTKEAERGKPKENKVHRNHVTKNLFVTPPESNRDCQ